MIDLKESDTIPPSSNGADLAVQRLAAKAGFLRANALALNNRTLHAGGALSSADLLAVLFYHTLKLRPAEPQWPDRDIFINSRGHASLKISATGPIRVAAQISPIRRSCGELKR